MIKLVTKGDERCFLEICIPTYKRSRELNRLLSVLENELENAAETVTLRITVSDNCSPDDTQLMLATHALRDRLVVRTQPSNIGPLLNIWGLYERSNAEYVWMVSDDDIPKQGALGRIVRTLSSYKPAVLTFEFEQPPGSAQRCHGNRDGIEEFTDLAIAVPHLLILGKLTKYVVNGVCLTRALRNVQGLKETGYGWLALILDALWLADRKTVVVDHEFLAGCDENYARVTGALRPRFWDDYLLLLDHPMVTEHCGEYADGYRRGHGRYMVQLMYGVLAGVIKAEKTDAFEKKGRELPFDTGYFRNPFILLEWLSLRSGIPASRFVCAIERWWATSLRRLLGPLRRQTSMTRTTGSR